MTTIAQVRFNAQASREFTPVRSFRASAFSPSRVTASASGDVLTVAVVGRFDLAISPALWTATRWQQASYREYQFIMTAVTELLDSGVAWLTLFTRRAAARHAIVTVSGCSQSVSLRCKTAGLTVCA